MKSNKEIVFEFIQKHTDIINGKKIKEFNTQYLCDQLHIQRTNLSTILNSLVKEKRIEKINGRPVLYRLANIGNDCQEESSCFKRLIGYDGSLKNAVQLAKAAILYPENSLHTLIIGPAGSGKSLFANLMYKFAIENKVINEKAPFIKFNCRNYDDCEEQMIIKLFGNKNFKECALHEANHGILFIDHVNLLPAHARSTLFNLLENEKKNILDVIIICATNASINTTLKEAYSAKFSVKIDLPSLKNRKMDERLKLIQFFFAKEAVKMKRIIKINAELLRCILLYHCDYNVKQLKTDIKIGCANAYVREFNVEMEVLNIYMNDFPNYLRKGFLFYKDFRDEIEHLIPDNYSYSFSAENMEKIKESDFLIENQQTVYDVIEKKAAELRERGITEEDINTIVCVDIESDLKSITNRLTMQNINKETLTKIVNNKIISLVEKFLDEASARFDRVYPVSTFYGLCLHLSATLERANKAQQLANEKIMEIVEKFKDEYSFCMKFACQVEKTFNIRLPIDEVIFITMFICNKSFQNQTEKKPIVLIAMHGRTTASSIAEVVNTLVKSENTYAFDLFLEKDMQVAYEELKAYIQEIDMGKGIIMLYDMGSLKEMGDMISQETGIHIRMIEVPATLIALDCARKASCEASLDNVFNGVMESYQQSFCFMKDSYQRQMHNSVIITLCMTGKGGAIQMKQFLEKNIDTKDIDILPLAVSDREYLLNEVNTIKKDRVIQCVIGTYDPQLYGIPFISISKLFDTSIDKLPMLLALEDIETEIKVDYEAIYEYLSEQLTTVDTKDLKKYLPKVILKIKKLNQGLTQDQELGLFLHIACSIHRIKKKDKVPCNIHKETILNKNKKLYNELLDILEPLEEVFEVSFNNDELANIIRIIKQI